ncbi:MAG: alkaline phosphatase [Chloroflexi bacterium]|nr:alkaline phosphatase [Chloroflexota bacterium]
MNKKIVSFVLLACMVICAFVTSFSGVFAQNEASAPKYIFLFVGDGMSYPQFQTASDYLGQLQESDDILSGGIPLSFMEFPIAGSATTFDSTSFAPDSASTATSFATGHKTYSGIINMDESKTIPYETIAEKLKKQLNYKVGIITSVNLNHATPAAFYAHQPSRGNYYEIGEELVASGFEFFGGGAMISPTGKEKDKKDIYEVMVEGGYKVVKTYAEANAVTAADEKVVIIGETLADSNALSYELDRAENEWSLADYVRKGIEVINNETGFFMMVEGGKIDWACHANDAGATIGDTIALDDAVKVASEFAAQHPEDTLILVTGDHETGGLSIGFAGTRYDTYLQNLASQKITYARYDVDYVEKYIENKTSFDEAMVDVAELFGLTLPANAASAAQPTLVLTNSEVADLENAFNLSINGGTGDRKSYQEYLMYGGYEPFSITINHILNNKSGLSFTSYSHTGLPVAVFAQGNGEDLFKGYYDNTDIYFKLAELTGVN